MFLLYDITGTQTLLLLKFFYTRILTFVTAVKRRNASESYKVSFRPHQFSSSFGRTRAMNADMH